MGRNYQHGFNPILFFKKLDLHVEFYFLYCALLNDVSRISVIHSVCEDSTLEGDVLLNYLQHSILREWNEP